MASSVPESAMFFFFSLAPKTRISRQSGAKNQKIATVWRRKPEKRDNLAPTTIAVQTDNKAYHFLLEVIWRVPACLVCFFFLIIVFFTFFFFFSIFFNRFNFKNFREVHNVCKARYVCLFYELSRLLKLETFSILTVLGVNFFQYHI